MKNVIVGIMLCLFMGCSLVNNYYDSEIENLLDGKQLYYGDFEEIKTVQEIGYYLIQKIDYKVDEVEEWSNPEETLNRGYGDCDDYAILYLNILYVRFGIKGSLAVVNHSREIVNGGITNHVVVFNDKIIEPQNGQEVLYDIGYIFSFDEVFN